VTKRFGSKAALKQVTCQLEGQAIGLVGPNGAGKTTLMKLCLGLLKADEGRIHVLGQEITPRTANRGLFGFAAEGTGHLPDLSGLECVAYAGQLCGLSRRTSYLRAHDMLDLVGLDEARYRPAEAYSTGMLQRTKVAMALAHDPDLLFLDEPTSGLDPTSRADFLDLLVHLREADGPAIILSTHILHDVERACDQVLILADGEVRYSGSIEDLRTVSTREYDVRLLKANGAFETRLQQVGADISHQGRGVYRVKLLEGQSPETVWQSADHIGAQIIGFEELRADFEAAFLDQVGGISL